MSETTADLTLKLRLAEDKLDDLAGRTRDAYRLYRALDDQQTAKAEEVKELRRQIRGQQWDRAFLVADEDVSFPDDSDGGGQ